MTQDKLRSSHLFSILGTCRNCNETALHEEAQLYDDLVVFDFWDTYPYLTIKTIVSLNWVFNVYKSNIYLKVDDDALFNVTDVYQTVLRYLHNNTGHIGVLGYCRSGLPVRRDLQHKWGVSKEAYSPPTYPRFCFGHSYALTRSAVSLLLKQTHNTPLIHLEDVSVGLLAQKAGNINLINIYNWLAEGNLMDDNLQDYRKYHTIHTGQGRIEEVEKLWKNIYNYTNYELQSKVGSDLKIWGLNKF